METMNFKNVEEYCKWVKQRRGWIFKERTADGIIFLSAADKDGKEIYQPIIEVDGCPNCERKN